MAILRITIFKNQEVIIGHHQTLVFNMFGDGDAEMYELERLKSIVHALNVLEFNQIITGYQLEVDAYIKPEDEGG